MIAEYDEDSFSFYIEQNRSVGEASCVRSVPVLKFATEIAFESDKVWSGDRTDKRRIKDFWEKSWVLLLSEIFQ